MCIDGAFLSNGPYLTLTASMNKLPQTALTEVGLLFLLNKVEGEDDEWVDNIRYFSPNSLNLLASLPLRVIIHIDA